MLLKYRERVNKHDRRKESIGENKKMVVQQAVQNNHRGNGLAETMVRGSKKSDNENIAEVLEETC